MKKILMASLLALPLSVLSTVSLAASTVENTVESIVESTAGSGQHATTPTTKQSEVDGWTSASTIFYYEASTYDKEQLGQVVRDMSAAIAIATVNPDGSANGAVIRPSMTVDNEYLMFRFGHNQTARNFKAGKPGIVIIYKYSPEAEDKFVRNQGARLEVVYEDDPEKIAELMETNASNGAIEMTTFLRIKRIFPLG